MSVFVNPFTDFGFKRIFGQEDSKKFLIAFLNALFEGEFIITDLIYNDKERLGQITQERGVLFDIYCTLSDGRHFILEMQNQKQLYFDARALYYASKAIVSQGKKGAWNYNYCPVIGVYFMNFNEERLGQAYRIDFSMARTKEVFVEQRHEAGEQCPKTALQCEHLTTKQDCHGQPFADKLRLVFLQMRRFSYAESECKTDLEKWMFIMVHMDKLQNIPWKAQDELFDELSKVSNVAALSPDERFVYEENLRIYQDNIAVHEAALEEGRIEGIAEGKKEGQRQTVKAFIAIGLSNEQIRAATGMSDKDIDELRETDMPM